MVCSAGLVVNVSSVLGQYKDIGSPSKHIYSQGPPDLFVSLSDSLILLKCIFCKLLCLEQSTSLKHLCL